MRFRRISALCVCVLCGCASAPKIDYYTLGRDSSGRASPTVNLSVERFRSVEALNRSQIMVLESPSRIDYYAGDHWAGSIGELVQQKLAAEFGPLDSGRKTLIVSGTVVSCEQLDRPEGAEARVELEVVVRDSEIARYRPPLLEKTYASTRPVGGTSVESLVMELSRCVEDIAAEIAADIATL